MMITTLESLFPAHSGAYSALGLAVALLIWAFVYYCFRLRDRPSVRTVKMEAVLSVVAVIGTSVAMTFLTGYSVLRDGPLVVKILLPTIGGGVALITGWRAVRMVRSNLPVRWAPWSFLVAMIAMFIASLHVLLSMLMLVAYEHWLVKHFIAGLEWAVGHLTAVSAIGALICFFFEYVQGCVIDAMNDEDDKSER